MLKSVQRLINFMRGVQFNHVIVSHDAIIYSTGYLASDAVQAALQEKAVIEAALAQLLPDNPLDIHEATTVTADGTDPLPTKEEVFDALGWIHSSKKDTKNA